MVYTETYYESGEVVYHKRRSMTKSVDNDTYFEICLGRESLAYKCGQIIPKDAGHFDKRTNTRVFENCTRYLNDGRR